MFPEPQMLAFSCFTWWRKVRKPGETTLNGQLLSCYIPVLGIEHHFSVEDYANRKCLPWYLNPFHNGGLELWKKNLLPWKDSPFYARKTSSETDYTMAVYPLSIKFIDLEYHVAKISWTLACEHQNRNTNTQKENLTKKSCGVPSISIYKIHINFSTKQLFFLSFTPIPFNPFYLLYPRKLFCISSNAKTDYNFMSNFGG